MEAIKLGLQGVTILAASGDDGANSRDVRQYGSVACGYKPSWPASSPYVTAVGATQGPEASRTEIACQSNEGSQITTGGGFSTLYPVPSWQKDTMDKYWTALEDSGNMPHSGYATGARGYPDLSIAGNNFDVIIGRVHYCASGTSASTPVRDAILLTTVAAMVSYTIEILLPFIIKIIIIAIIISIIYYFIIGCCWHDIIN